MPLKPLPFALLAVMVAAAESLPVLRTEAVDAGSVFHVKNGSQQPLAAFLIELVDYPGSSYWLFQDDAASPIAPGAEKRIPVTNMTVGAAPEYVKITAALYADGSTAGPPERVALIVGRRKAALEATREAIRKIEAAKEKAAAMAALKQWADSLQPQGKGNRLTQANVDQAAARSVASHAAAFLEQHSIEETIADLTARAR